MDSVVFLIKMQSYPQQSKSFKAPWKSKVVKGAAILGARKAESMGAISRKEFDANFTTIRGAKAIKQHKATVTPKQVKNMKSRMKQMTGY